mmetsp:Transcript_34109/g.37691  ORF Transcript_34109/g.37691 Transcript_34109/m.37691 type:complete len:213 (+) Transcript_34109:372-1010(+)
MTRVIKDLNQSFGSIMCLGTGGHERQIQIGCVLSEGIVDINGILSRSNFKSVFLTGALDLEWFDCHIGSEGALSVGVKDFTIIHRWERVRNAAAVIVIERAKKFDNLVPNPCMSSTIEVLHIVPKQCSELLHCLDGMTLHFGEGQNKRIEFISCLLKDTAVVKLMSPIFLVGTVQYFRLEVVITRISVFFVVLTEGLVILGDVRKLIGEPVI